MLIYFTSGKPNGLILFYRISVLLHQISILFYLIESQQQSSISLVFTLNSAVIVYEELRRQISCYLRKERRIHTQSAFYL